jgi:uncharacterized protein YydD (DUF2326 family)
MRLSKLYCNQPEIFPAINFREGLNVVHARVTRPKESDKDSHNLGKTLLLHLIDFMLLKGFDSGHFLHDNHALFKSFVFFMELERNGGGFITVRRGVERPTKISLQSHPTRAQDLSELPDEKWQCDKLPFEKARQALNSELAVSDTNPWDFRKGLGYFLRAQGDYRDVFQLAKFAIGKHKDWKPFMVHLIGLDYVPVQEKYEVDEEIQRRQQAKQDVKEVTGADSEIYDKFHGALEIKRGEATESRVAIDRFDFFQQDMRLNGELVDEVESQVASLNDRLYTIDYEAKKLEDALNRGITFDLDAVTRLFQEAQTVMPDALKRSYAQLLDFNVRLSSDRGKRLEDTLRRLREDRANSTEELRRLNARREELLQVVQDTETLSKYRKLQSRLTKLEAEIARLETQLEQLDQVAKIDNDIQQLEMQRSALVQRIATVVRTGSLLYTKLKQEFNRLLRHVLEVPALISTSVNAHGNVEFDATLLQSETSQITTSEDRGTSYRHLMCCAFDMALISAHASGSFYRFVYHDGVFEALDDRKKLRLLEVVRSFVDRAGMQYILTVIDSDMPRDSSDHVVPFKPGEVVRELFEGSDDGRLFRMPKF